MMHLLLGMIIIFLGLIQTWAALTSHETTTVADFRQIEVSHRPLNNTMSLTHNDWESW